MVASTDLNSLMIQFHALSTADLDAIEDVAPNESPRQKRKHENDNKTWKSVTRKMQRKSIRNHMSFTTGISNGRVKLTFFFLQT